MNPKFFDVKKEKQDAIINACLKIFAENGYKKASTDVIVKEAGISKGLLFHYFESKKGAYQFIYDYSLKYMILELTQSVQKSERDFFEIQRTIEEVKTRVMKNYPYMQQFLDGIRFENHPDALSAIGEDKDVLKDTYNAIYRQADMTKFDDYIDVNRVIQMIGWMSEGFIKDKFREKEPDLDAMNEEFTKYLMMLKDHLYKPGIRRGQTLGREAGGMRPMPKLSFIGQDMGDAEELRGREEKRRTESTGSSSGGLAELLMRNASRNREEGSGSRTNSVNKENVMGYMKQEKTSSSLLRELNKSPEQLSFEERLAIKDTSVFGVPAPPKKPKKEESPKEEVLEEDKKKDEKLSEESRKAVAGEKREDQKREDKENKEKEKSSIKEAAKEKGKTEESKASETEIEEDIKIKESIGSKGRKLKEDIVEEVQTSALKKDEKSEDEDADMTIAPEKEAVIADAGETVSKEVAEFLNKVSNGTIKLSKEAGGNVVDHEGIRVTKISRKELGEEEDAKEEKIEEAVKAVAEEEREKALASKEKEEPMAVSEAEKPAESSDFNTEEIPYIPMYSDYSYGNFSYGQQNMANMPGMGDMSQMADMQGAPDQYYQDGYYGGQENYNEQQAYPYYRQEPAYAPEDMAALAELYNNVNYDYASNDLNGNPGGFYVEPEYDLNGNTNEMPVNEVLAYRNAFTDQYMREEIAKIKAAKEEGNEALDQKDTEKEEKPKKKSFFGGLFGGRNKARSKEE
ncbi:MAG: TetR family transcriptional regulator [Lachnospiraceae bacterium]|nr:TetR family transcriptional regulator [Lachnospiraceae bacterium]